MSRPNRSWVGLSEAENPPRIECAMSSTAAVNAEPAGTLPGQPHASCHRVRRRRGWPIVVASCTLALIVGFAILQRTINRRLAIELPDLPPVPVLSAFGDQTPVAVTITADWQKVIVTVPAYTVSSDVTLWRNMNFDDWDTVSERLREDGLTAMWKRFGHLVNSPAQWDRMTAHDWDWIPQPIRAMAYIRMMKYWSGYYQVGTRFGLPRGTVTNTMNAIVMAESWFEHRGSHTNPGGDRDIGLGGSSEYCRRTIQHLAQDGAVDFTLEEDDYFDPWRATRVVAVWFELMLQEANGDLDLAIRSYHRGWPLARRGEGEVYLANVKRLRRLYIRNEDNSPAWHFLFDRARNEELAKAAVGTTNGSTRSAGNQGDRYTTRE